jgi:hypothetical protein
VRRADVMDVDAGAQARPPASGAGVIEVDVGEQDITNIAGGDVVLGEALQEGGQG